MTTDDAGDSSQGLVRTVGDEEIADALRHYAQEGWALLPAVGTPDAMAGLRARLDALLSGALPDPGLFVQAEAQTGRYDDVRKVPGALSAGGTFRKVEKLERDPVCLAWLQNPVFARIAARVHPGPVNLYRATLFNKAPRVGSDTPWHQDGGRLWGLDTEPRIQLWTALDDAPPASGCLEVVPRSHRGGLATPLGGVVPAARCVGVEILPLPARAGDVLVLHNHLWHRSGPNRTEQPRRGLTACLIPASTRCVRTKKAPRTFPRLFPVG